ncbi:MAG: sulfatase-like hydrolase/transferase, partial [Promethearchaeota archaeon]
MGADRLALYGGKIETPNITSMGKSGTVYRNYVTCAASSAMSLIGMFTGLFPHETGVVFFDDRDYAPLKNMREKNRERLLLPCLEDLGYETYFVWYGYVQELYEGNLLKFKSWKGSRTRITLFKQNSPTENYHQLKEMIETVKKPWFIFLFFNPIASRRFAGASVKTTKMTCDDFIYDADNLVGMIRDIVGNDTVIYVTADHGHAHGEHGELGYAMPLCESILRIPLVSTNGNGVVVDDYISNTNFGNIVLNRKLKNDKYLYSSNVYSGQISRRVAIRKRSWKYIRHSPGWAPRGEEELYDLQVDPSECCNLLRKRSVAHSDKRYELGTPWLQGLPRADWDEVERIYSELRTESEKVWQPLHAPSPTEEERWRHYIEYQKRFEHIPGYSLYLSIQRVLRDPSRAVKILRNPLKTIKRLLSGS